MFFKSRRPFPKNFLDLEKLFKPENMHVFKCRNIFQLPRKILFKFEKRFRPQKCFYTNQFFFFLKICFQLRSQKVLKCTKSSSFFPSSWSKLYRIVWSLFALWILFSTNYSCRHLSALSVREISNVVEFTRLR